VINLPYGRISLKINIPDHDVIVIEQNKKSTGNGPADVDSFEKSLKHPLIKDSISNLSLAKKNVAIAINDKTRPLPYELFLEKFLQEIKEIYGCPKKIEFYVATGTHKPLTIPEINEMLPGNITKSYNILNHDCDDGGELFFLGNTSQNTPVYVNKKFYEADVKIALGCIAPHHFMGFSGGAKTCAIGLAGRNTIEKNHAMLLHPNAKMGLFKSNPMRMDVEEIAKLMKIDLAFNIIQDDNKKILHYLFGEPDQVMLAGVQYFYDHSQPIDEKHINKYDLVIASCGGYPKDINLYQAQKAITHASFFAKPQGIIILVADCVQGYGSDGFVDFLKKFDHAEELINQFERMQFKLGPHKAYQLAKQAIQNKIILVSNIKDQDYLGYLVTFEKNIHNAIQNALHLLPQKPKIAVLPFATSLIPYKMDL